MKQRIFAVLTTLCLLAATSAMAQNAPKAPSVKERPSAEQMAQQMTDRMTKRLNLTDAQAKQVYQINLRKVQRMAAQREQMRKERQTEAEQMKGILTTEQFVEWARMQGPRPGSAHKGAGMHHGKGPMKGDKDRRGAPECCQNGKTCPAQTVK